MKLMISTQYMENYGAHDWDGEGECPQYWKFKGGEEYFVRVGTATDVELLTNVVDSVRGELEWDNPASRQYILGWELVADDYMTEFEQSQLDYEGEIRHPARYIESKLLEAA